MAEEARQCLLADCSKMKGRLLGLVDSHGRVVDEVHAIRKLGKSLRGGLHLFLLGHSGAREIQAIGRLLAGPRDAVSRQSTWNKIDWNDHPPTAAAISGLLEIYVQSAARRPSVVAVDWCLLRVDEAANALDRLPSEELPGRMEKGMEKLRGRFRRRAKRLKHGAQEDFHEARKAVKALLGALALLPEEFLPEEFLPESSPHFQSLAETLGDENDLATLSAWLEGHGFTDHFAPSLWHQLATNRLELQNKAIRIASALVETR